MTTETTKSTEEFHDQFSVLHMLVGVTVHHIEAADEFLQDQAKLYGIEEPLLGSLLEDGSLREQLYNILSGAIHAGSAEGWRRRLDVARVIQHRDGRITVFARSIPRLSREEVRHLHCDLFSQLPETSDVRLVAVWKRY